MFLLWRKAAVLTTTPSAIVDLVACSEYKKYDYYRNC